MQILHLEVKRGQGDSLFIGHIMHVHESSGGIFKWYFQRVVFLQHQVNGKELSEEERKSKSFMPQRWWFSANTTIIWSLCVRNPFPSSDTWGDGEELGGRGEKRGLQVSSDTRGGRIQRRVTDNGVTREWERRHRGRLWWGQPGNPHAARNSRLVSIETPRQDLTH